MFLARRSLDYRDPSELRITYARVRARRGSCVRNDGHYAYRIRVTGRTGGGRNAFDYATKDARRAFTYNGGDRRYAS